MLHKAQMEVKTDHSFVVCDLFCLNFGKDYTCDKEIKIETIRLVMNFRLMHSCNFRHIAHEMHTISL